MESLVTLKQALDEGLIDAADYQRGKEAFLASWLQAHFPVPSSAASAKPKGTLLHSYE